MATVDDLTFTLSSDGTYYSVKAANTSIYGNLEIPSKYGGLSVKEIAHGAFSDCLGLTSIIIPDSVTNIGDSAFWRCTSLTSIIIPDSVTNIGEWVFAYCSSLISVRLPDGLTDISRAAFLSCTGLISIKLPVKLKYIDSGGFTGCSLLTSIELPASITGLGLSVFAGCKSLTYFKFNGDAVTAFTGVLDSTPNLTSIHVNPFATGYGSTWGGKSVVVDNPVYYKGKRICKAYIGSKRKRGRP